MRVMVLEDSPERIEWFKDRFGDDIDQTLDIAEAIHWIANNKYDIIFLDRDLSNPKHTGEDVAWEMMENHYAKDTPIVIHSENDRGQRVMYRYLKKYHKKVLQRKWKYLKSFSADEIVQMALKPDEHNLV